jgi:hypothetical protein
LNHYNGGPQKPAVFLPKTTPTQLENDPRSEIRNFWEHMPPPGGPLG